LSHCCRNPLTCCLESRGKNNAIHNCFSSTNTQEVSAADARTAREALAIISALQERSEQIRFIRSPQEGEIGVEMLWVLAKEEEDELPAVA
jgi:hypothetical protein